MTCVRFKPACFTCLTAFCVKTRNNVADSDVHEASKSHRRSASASLQPPASKVKNQHQNQTPVLDFSESNEFRSRVGSIVKRSANVTNSNANAASPDECGMNNCHSRFLTFLPTCLSPSFCWFMCRNVHISPGNGGTKLNNVLVSVCSGHLCRFADE